MAKPFDPLRPPPFPLAPIDEPIFDDADELIAAGELRPAPVPPEALEAVSRLGLLAREAEREARRLQVLEDLGAIREMTAEIAAILGRVKARLDGQVPS